MITSQKIMLLINDPKFRQVKSFTRNNQQQALNKIYANQKQMHRSKVIAQCLIKNIQPKSVIQTTDYLQSKIQTVEKTVVQDIQSAYNYKQSIEKKYKEMETVYEKTLANFKSLTKISVEEKDYQRAVVSIQKQVDEIKRLYEANDKLKNQNNLIKKRIKEKTEKYKIMMTP